jgi:hypothetical protein
MFALMKLLAAIATQFKRGGYDAELIFSPAGGTDGGITFFIRVMKDGEQVGGAQTVFYEGVSDAQVMESVKLTVRVLLDKHFARQWQDETYALIA